MTPAAAPRQRSSFSIVGGVPPPEAMAAAAICLLFACWKAGINSATVFSTMSAGVISTSSFLPVVVAVACSAPTEETAADVDEETMAAVAAVVSEECPI